MSRPTITEVCSTHGDVAIKFETGEGVNRRERTVRVSVNNGYLNLHFCGLQDDTVSVGSLYANGVNVAFEKNLYGC